MVIAFFLSVCILKNSKWATESSEAQTRNVWDNKRCVSAHAHGNQGLNLWRDSDVLSKKKFSHNPIKKKCFFSIMKLTCSVLI